MHTSTHLDLTSLPAYQVLLEHFDNDPAQLSQGLQPVFLYTDEDTGEDIYQPYWFAQKPGLANALTPTENALLAYLFLDMTGDAAELLTHTHLVLPLEETLGLEPA